MHFDGKMNGMFYEKGVNPFEVSFQCLSSRAAPLVSRSGQHHSVAPTPSTRRRADGVEVGNQYPRRVDGVGG